MRDGGDDSVIIAGGGRHKKENEYIHHDSSPRKTPGGKTPSSESGIRGVKGRKRRGNEIEVEAYENPTELFQWINYRDWENATERVISCPSEASVWIVSRNSLGREGDSQKSENGNTKWRYLPLHLVCLNSNPYPPLVHALIDAYPKGARSRDHEGNLPLHYVCSEGCDDADVVNSLVHAYPESLEKRDGMGRTVAEILQIKGSFDNGSTKSQKTVLTLNHNKLTGNQQHDGDTREPFSGQTNVEFRQQQGDTEERDQPDVLSTDKTYYEPDNVSHNQAINGLNSTEGPTAHTAVGEKLSAPSNTRKHRTRASTKSKHKKGDSNAKRNGGTNNLTNKMSTIGQRKKIESKGTQKLDLQLESFDSEISKGKKKEKKRESQEMVLQLERKLDDALAERDVLRDSVERLTNENAAQKSKIAMLNAKLEKCDAKSEMDKETIEKSCLRIETLTTEVSVGSAELDELRSQVAKLAHEKEECNAMLSRQEAEFQNKLFAVRDALHMQTEAFAECTTDVMADEKPAPQNETSEHFHSNGNEDHECGHRDEIQRIKTASNFIEQQLRSKISSLERDLTTATSSAEQSESLKKELVKVKTEFEISENHLKSRIASLEMDLAVATEGATQAASLKEEMSTMMTEFESVEQKLSSRITSLVSELARASSAERESNLRDEVDVLKAELEAVENSELTDTARATQLRRELDALKAESEAVENELRSQIASLETELLKAAADAAVQGSKASAENARSSHLKDELDALKAESEAVENGLRSQIASLKSDLAKAAADAAAAQETKASADKLRGSQLHDKLEGLKAVSMAVENRLRSQIALLESDLTKAAVDVASREANVSSEKARASKLKDEINALKAESMIVENGLRSQIASLEADLTKVMTTHNAKQSTDSIAEQCMIELKRINETLVKELHALRFMNKSLQEQMSMLQEKCNGLERQQRDIIRERDALLTKFDTSSTQVLSLDNHRPSASAQMSERQRELQTEFKSLLSSLKDISKTKPVVTGDASNVALEPHSDVSLEKSVKELTVQNKEYQKRVQELRDMISKNNASYRKRVDDLLSMQSMLKEENKALKEGLQILKAEASKCSNKEQSIQKQASLASPDSLGAQEMAPKELSNKVNMDETQMRDLLTKCEALQRKNNALRETIMKNNVTYLAKIEELSNKCKELERCKAALQENVAQLVSDNGTYQKHFERMLEAAKASHQNPKETPTLDKLADRVISVAAFLASISEIQKRIVEKAARQENWFKPRAAEHGGKMMCGIEVPAEKQEGQSRAVAKEDGKMVEDTLRSARVEQKLTNKALAQQKAELESISAGLASLQKFANR